MQYVARQAILDADRCLTAYELLFRDSTENRCPRGDPDIASRRTIDTAVLLGLETLSDGHRVFLNCTENLILDGLPTLFPPEVTVVEILESVRPTRQSIDACQKLKEGGYCLALDDFVEQPGYEPLIELAEVIKIDVRLTPAEHWPALAAKYLHSHRQLLAEKVETEEEFARAKTIGFSLFQGDLFSKPRILSTSSIDGLDANHIRILRTLASPQLNLLEVESIIKSDPALCYRLLRFLNSPAFYLQDEIRSVLHALALLGEVEIRKWMLLVCALGASAGTSKKHLLETALIRARFAESLAPKMDLSSSALFLLGILSLMHAILDLSAEALVELVAVSADIRAALLGTSNSLLKGFDLVLHTRPPTGIAARRSVINGKFQIASFPIAISKRFTGQGNSPNRCNVAASTHWRLTSRGTIVSTGFVAVPNKSAKISYTSRTLMRIVDAKVIVCCPGRNFVTLKILTEDGVYGLGDATLNGRELAVASYLSDHVVPLLIGRDARRIEDIWQYLYKGAYWRRGPVTMAAIAAVDTALWDIKAKSLNTPLYQLLGGASRDAVLVYGHASGANIEDTVSAVANYLKAGYKAIRAQAGIPGLASTYGVGSGPGHYEPAEKNAPPENLWSSEAYMNFIPTLFARLRKEFGNELHLLHDVHHRLTPIEAARVGKELESYHLFWMEDPTPAELQESFRLIRRHTTTPIAVGEVFNSIFDCQQLIQEQLIDYIRATVVHAGGVSHLRKIANLAELYQVRTGCHGATDLSPVCMAAALHFDLSVHNFGIQEYMPHTKETDEVFPHAYSFENGFMHPGDAPGLGVDINEQLAGNYPYQRAYLPTNRKLDGTMHSW